ncbi:dipeptide ABC transporter ATP-binding protein [Microbacterium marinilacus]|uniref:ABC transporter ATP-binding protein n=1 Tax=Microbacterium marinilacus TaxID=415209 RepID=A0ABP7BUH2_9MICO|nr:ABC transporter ATP-binding protein [Microbacterium marinilacus]MBY0688156.1 ABC transporter ATP-binding protein [Microbacterium marinilacus]
MTTLLTLESLDVTYSARHGEVPANRDVSLEVRPGETVAIVGESGSGKSTLVARLLGLLGPEAKVRQDAYRLQGQDVSRLGDRAWSRIRGRRIGFIPQDPAGSLDPVQTIGAQVQEALGLNGVPRRERAPRAEELLRTAGIEQPERYLSLYPHQLSGGTCQRVLIAIAIAGDPGLIIADEPTSALDVTTQKHVLDHLAGLVRDSGASLVLITHDLGVALDRSDRIVVMRGGRVVETGETLEVFRDPQEEYTRRLVRSAPSLVEPRPRASVTERRAATSAEPAPIVEVRGVRKVFEGHGRGGDTVAVADASLDLARGTTLSVVGQSGSGKSTLARLVLGLERPTTGAVAIRSGAGETIDPHALGRGGLKRLSRVAQMVYQNPYASLHPQFRIADIVAEPLRAHGVGTSAERRGAVSDLLEAVGLDPHLADRTPRELSGGQRQRVAIARALALGPELVVLDEPVSALDVSVQEQILELLIQLQDERGLAYLFISHDLAVVRQISDEVIVMHRGEFVERGPASRVLQTPEHPYTRALLAASPGRRLRENA